MLIRTTQLQAFVPLHSLSALRSHIRRPTSLSLTRYRTFRTMPVSSVIPKARLASEMDAEQAMKTPALQVKLLSETAKAPTRGSEAAAGLDLYASEDNVVPPRGKALVKTGLQMRIPMGCYGRVAPRSGLALKKFIDVGAGVIDADYNGEVGVVLFNFSADEFVVKTGDRIAQLILERICMAPVVVVDAIDDTQRGAGGFGSTGTN